MGFLLGIPAYACVVVDAIGVYSERTNATAMAYLVSSLLAAVLLLTSTITIAVGTRVPMPYYPIVFLVYTVSSILYAIWKKRYVRYVNCLAAVLLYWNYILAQSVSLTAQATQPLLVHTFVFCYMRNKT